MSESKKHNNNPALSKNDKKPPKNHTIEFLELFGELSMIVALDDKSQNSPLHQPQTLRPENVNSAFGAMNLLGTYGLYFLVNESKNPIKRTAAHITRARAIWIEDDTTGAQRTDFPLPPHITINSSPGKYHYYWLTSTTDLDEHQQVMQRLVDDYACDPNARDISRILRIPGYYNHKYEKKHLITAEFNKKEIYDWETIKQHFPPKPVKNPNSDTDSNSFNLSAAIDNIINDKNYHNSMVSIALHYANLHLSEKNIISQIMALKTFAPKNERSAARFSLAHVRQCVESALEKVNNENAHKKDIQLKLDDVIHSAPKNAEFDIDSPTLDIETLAPENTVFGRLVRCVYNASYQKNLMAAFIAASSTVAYLAGGKYRITGFDGNDKLKVNLQQIGLGGSGCGKDPIIGAPGKIIDAVFMAQKDLYGLLLQNTAKSVGSRQGIEDCLLEGNRHDFMLLLDECGTFFNVALSKIGTPQYDLLSFMLEAFSADNVGTRKLAKNKNDKTPTVGQVLYNLNFVFAGASTPQRFSSGMSDAYISHGIGSRILLHNCGAYYEPRHYDDTIAKIDKNSLGAETCEILRKIADHSVLVQQKPEGIAYGLPLARHQNPVQIAINSKFTDKLFFTRCVQHYQSIPQHSPTKAIWSRFDINSRVLGAIFALCDDPENPIITEQHAVRAIKITQLSCEYQQSLFENGFQAESEADKLRVAILKILHENAPKPVSRTGLYHAASVIKTAKPHEKDAVLDDLIKENLIEEVRFKAPKAKRTTLAYQLLNNNH